MPVKTPRTLGHQLRNARIAKGLTQRQLAKVIGTHTQSIGNWELDLNRPQPRHMKAICAFLGGASGAK